MSFLSVSLPQVPKFSSLLEFFPSTDKLLEYVASTGALLEYVPAVDDVKEYVMPYLALKSDLLEDLDLVYRRTAHYLPDIRLLKALLVPYVLLTIWVRMPGVVLRLT